MFQIIEESQVNLLEAECVFTEALKHVNPRQHPSAVGLLRLCRHFMPNTPRDENLRCADGEFLPAAHTYTSLRILKAILGDCPAVSEAGTALREELQR
jgi:hypothetical protein